jgi:hypothetical protein
MKMHRFSPEQKEFVRIHLNGRKQKDLLDMFNDHFGTDIKINQLRAFIKNNRFTSGIDATFKPSSVPFNKGKKKYWVGGEATQFKKGQNPHNYLPVGSERVNGDDYVDIKVADPNKWRGKHILVWEEHNGPVPKSHAIIFGDGNRRNFEPDNLICVSRAQLVRLNQNHLIRNDSNLTRTGVVVVDVIQKISELKKKK